MMCRHTCRRCGRLLPEFIWIEITIIVVTAHRGGPRDGAPPAEGGPTEWQSGLPLFPRQFV
jgi:hypothetical protein